MPVARIPAALLCIVFLISRQAPAADSPAERPNILFLFADDQRADTIAAHGNPAIQTPNLDKLARSGVSFRKAYMQGGMQGATCVPSRAMLLSGQSLFRVDEKLMRDPTWPEAFRDSGYSTFVSGKWHNGDASIAKCFQSARSMFTGGMTDPMQAPLRQLEGGVLGKPKKTGQHACEVFADEAIRFLHEHKTGPFLCYLPFDAPHDPHIVPDAFTTRYDPASLPLPPNFLPEHPFDNGEMKIRDEVLLPWPRTPDAVRSMLAEYYRYVSYLDQQIGRVLEALAASPHARNTIIVFSADSGVARGSHGLVGKQNLYEHSLRVPLIVSGPGIPQNTFTDALCYLFDVFPSLGGLCGVKGPASSEGLDLSGVLRDPSKPGRPHLQFAYRNVQQAVRDDQWKLIRYPKIERAQLFDLKADPFEMRDLSGDPSQSARIGALTALLPAAPR
jgi:arylsulfatase A-like enzyme